MSELLNYQKRNNTPFHESPSFQSLQWCSQFMPDGFYTGKFLVGRQPFRAESLMGLYDAICSEPLQFPPEIFISDSLKHLLRRLLEKDPSKRIGLLSVMNHQWVTHNGAYLLPNCRVSCHVLQFLPDCTLSLWRQFVEWKMLSSIRIDWIFWSFAS